jgi:hypothetical protein
MHRDEPHAGPFGPSCKLGRVAGAVIPAEPHFQRYRHVDGLDHRLDQRQRMIEVAHQRRPRRPVGDVLCRATHVDVDDRGAKVLGNACAFGHPARFAAGQLGDVEARTMGLDAPPLVAPAFGERGTCGHFRDDEARALTCDQAPEGCVSDPGHGR